MRVHTMPLMYINWAAFTPSNITDSIIYSQICIYYPNLKMINIKQIIFSAPGHSVDPFCVQTIQIWFPQDSSHPHLNSFSHEWSLKLQKISVNKTLSLICRTLTLNLDSNILTFSSALLSLSVPINFMLHILSRMWKWILSLYFHFRFSFHAKFKILNLFYKYLILISRYKINFSRFCDKNLIFWW